MAYQSWGDQETIAALHAAARERILVLDGSWGVMIQRRGLSEADFRADRKWQGYHDWCDRFFWAVDADFPVELLPEGTGLIANRQTAGKGIKHEHDRDR